MSPAKADPLAYVQMYILMYMETDGIYPRASIKEDTIHKVSSWKNIIELWHCFSSTPYMQLVILSYKKPKCWVKIYFMQYSEVHTEDTKKKSP